MADDLNLIRGVLENSHLFKSLDEAGREAMTRSGSVVRAPAGKILIEEGTDGDCFFVLIEGLVQVSSVKDGKPLILAELGRGAVLGEVALLTGEKRTATIMALKASVLVEFSEPGITEILGRYPKLKELLVRVLVHRAKDTIEKLMQDNSIS